MVGLAPPFMKIAPPSMYVVDPEIVQSCIIPKLPVSYQRVPPVALPVLVALLPVNVHAVKLGSQPN